MDKVIYDMITEDYVSFETAKLLKEKGFDSENVSEFGGFYVDYYHNGQFPGIATESMMLNKTLSYWEYLRPTLQMAMKWIREEKHIPIEILWHYDSNSDAEEWYFIHHAELRILPNNIEYYETYEEACEAAIKYCLEKLL